MSFTKTPAMPFGRLHTRQLRSLLALPVGGLPMDLAAIALAAVIGGILASIPPSTSDYGQWLMLSRYYTGEGIPSYRDVTAVPPLMPFSLGMLRLIVPDDMTALQIYKGSLGAGLVLSFYAAGSTIFQRRAAGLLGAIGALLVTDRLLELFAFGGMPQLLAMVFMGLSVAAFARGGTVDGLRIRWWALGTVVMVLAMLTHTALGTLTLVSGSAVAVVSALRNETLSRRQRLLAMVPIAVGVVVLAVYYAAVLLPANELYVTNPASDNYRHAGLIWDLLTAENRTATLLVVGAFCAVAGLTFELRRRRLDGFAVAAAWIAGIWGILLVSVVTQAETDYPRFVAPLLAPVAIAMGGGLAAAASVVGSRIKVPSAAFASAGIGLVLAVALGASLGPTTLGENRDASRYYSGNTTANDRAALQAAVVALDTALPADAAVLAARTLEGKWIEGLSGRSALFAIPVRFSFRLSERDRAIAADALLRSRMAMTSPYFFIKYIDARQSGATAVPEQPWIGINHRGEFLDLLRITSSGTKVLAAGVDGGVLATVGALDPVGVATAEDAQHVSVTTTWSGPRRGAPVTYTRTITLMPDSTSLEILDEATSPNPIGGIEVELANVQGQSPSHVLVSGNQVDLYYPAVGKAQPHVQVTAPGQFVQIDTADGRLVIRAPNAARLRLVVTSPTPTAPIQHLQLLDPAKVAEQFDVGAVLLKSDSATQFRIARLRAIGFEVAGDYGSYVTLTRPLAAQTGAAGGFSPGDFGGEP